MFLCSSGSSFCNWQKYVPFDKKLYDHKLPVNGRMHLVECVLHTGVTFIADEEFKRSWNR